MINALFKIKIKDNHNPPEFRKGMGKGVLFTFLESYKEDIDETTLATQLFRRSSTLLKQHIECTVEEVSDDFDFETDEYDGWITNEKPEYYKSVLAIIDIYKPHTEKVTGELEIVTTCYCQGNMGDFWKAEKSHYKGKVLAWKEKPEIPDIFKKD